MKVFRIYVSMSNGDGWWIDFKNKKIAQEVFDSIENKIRNSKSKIIRLDDDDRTVNFNGLSLVFNKQYFSDLLFSEEVRE